MEKQTAVEWLEKKFSDNEFDDCFYLATNQKWFEQAKEMEKQQIEISDEEILDAASRCRFNADVDISIGSFELGARWYREQLKKTK